jgi:hypothetical protein
VKEPLLIDGAESFAVIRAWTNKEDFGTAQEITELILWLADGSKVVVTAVFDRAVGGAFLRIGR